MLAVRALLAAVVLAGLTWAQNQVSFSTSDGWTIYADLYGTSDRCVVLAHGGRFEKGSWEKQARALVKAGFCALAIDLRGFGLSKEGQQAAQKKPDEIESVVLLAHGAYGPPERLKGRKLFIVSRDDLGSGDKPRLAKIRARYEKAPDPKELVILEGSAHAQFIFQTDQGERLMQEILRFL